MVNGLSEEPLLLKLTPLHTAATLEMLSPGPLCPPSPGKGRLNQIKTVGRQERQFKTHVGFVVLRTGVSLRGCFCLVFLIIKRVK